EVEGEAAPEDGAPGGGDPLQGPRADPGPSIMVQAGESSRALVLSGRGRSDARRQAAFRLTRDALDGLEAHLVLEEAELDRKHAELVADWARFFELRERCRQEDENLQARRDDALRLAKEIRDTAE